MHKRSLCPSKKVIPFSIRLRLIEPQLPLRRVGKGSPSLAPDSFSSALYSLGSRDKLLQHTHFFPIAAPCSVTPPASARAGVWFAFPRATGADVEVTARFF